MTAFDDVLDGNARYAAQFDDGQLAGRAARGLAVVTCMDARLDPLAMLGLQPGDAKVLRTAGGRVTDEVLRALVVAVHLLGVRRVLVVEHTDCGMAKLGTDAQAHQAVLDASGVDSRSLTFGTIGDQQATLAADVQRVRSWPYLPPDLVAAGGVFDVTTGRLSIVVEP
jgi:carbonic anhydrase